MCGYADIWICVYMYQSAMDSIMDMDSRGRRAGPGDGPHYCYGDLCERGGEGAEVGCGRVPALNHKKNQFLGSLDSISILGS